MFSIVMIFAPLFLIAHGKAWASGHRQSQKDHLCQDLQDLFQTPSDTNPFILMDTPVTMALETAKNVWDGVFTHWAQSGSQFITSLQCDENSPIAQITSYYHPIWQEGYKHFLKSKVTKTALVKLTETFLFDEQGRGVFERQYRSLQEDTPVKPLFFKPTKGTFVATPHGIEIHSFLDDRMSDDKECSQLFSENIPFQQKDHLCIFDAKEVWSRKDNRTQMSLSFEHKTFFEDDGNSLQKVSGDIVIQSAQVLQQELL